MTVDRTLAARLELRRALAELVRRFPRLTTSEAQERARAFLEHEPDNPPVATEEKNVAK